jgi:transcriptional regulator with XRE-family HTH domain
MKVDRERGQWIKERRKFLGIGQDQLAALLACEVRTLRYYEQGRRLPENIAVPLVGYLEIPPEQRDMFIRWLRDLEVPSTWRPWPANQSDFMYIEQTTRPNDALQTSTRQPQEPERQTAGGSHKYRTILPLAVVACILALLISATLILGSQDRRVLGISEAQTQTAVVPTPGPATPAAAQAVGTKRDVQLQVNSSLLRATIIDATVEALRFGSSEVAPATATAVQAEYEGNMATIEALRPTANALGIVLWQQPVQPTDAVEATLFAQAGTADAALTGGLGTLTVETPTVVPTSANQRPPNVETPTAPPTPTGQ